MPNARIESFRAGWPSYAPLGPNGEIILCHDFAATQLYFLTRENKGIGNWNESLYTYTSGPTTLACPRIITAGIDNNSIHIITNTFGEYSGQEYGIVYSRSQDGGITWDIENENA